MKFKNMSIGGRMTMGMLYLVFVLIEIVVLVNVTLFDSQRNGIMLFLCTGLFIVGTYFYLKQSGIFNRKDYE